MGGEIGGKHAEAALEHQIVGVVKREQRAARVGCSRLPGGCDARVPRQRDELDGNGRLRTTSARAVRRPVIDHHHLERGTVPLGEDAAITSGRNRARL